MTTYIVHFSNGEEVTIGSDSYFEGVFSEHVLAGRPVYDCIGDMYRFNPANVQFVTEIMNDEEE